LIGRQLVSGRKPPNELPSECTVATKLYHGMRVGTDLNVFFY